MAEYSTVDGSKNLFQRAGLFHNLLLERPLPGNIDGNANRPHNIAIKIIEGRLICSEKLRPLARLDRFLGHAGSSRFHYLALGLDTCRVILLHIPDKSMPPALDYLFGLVYRPAKTVVYLLMNPVFVLKPDQVRHTVNRCFQKMGGLSVIPILFQALLPS